VRERTIAGVAAPEEPEIVEPGLTGSGYVDAGLSRFCAASVLSFSGVWKLPVFGVLVMLPPTLPEDGCDPLAMKRETSSSCSWSVVESPMFDLDDLMEGAGDA
jgi:hypothetical protein